MTACDSAGRANVLNGGVKDQEKSEVRGQLADNFEFRISNCGFEKFLEEIFSQTA